MSVNFEDILEELEEMAEEAFNVPLSGGKCMVNGELLRSKLELLRLNLPAEIKRANEICAESEKIIEKAKNEYNAKLAAAETKAQYLLDNDKIVKEATKKAEQIINNANAEAEKLKIAAYKFVDDNLTDAENKLNDSLKSVNRVREKIANLKSSK